MGFNIEIKARVQDFERIKTGLAELGAAKAGVLDQVDEYFDCPRGRLKIRTQKGAGSEAIFYQREDSRLPKGSSYERVPTKEPEVLARILSSALGYLGRVSKQRTLYLLDNTRIHLDRVEGLGGFVELEVVLDSGAEADQGRRVAEEIMAALNIEEDFLISGSYIDLVLLDGRRYDAGDV